MLFSLSKASLYKLFRIWRVCPAQENKDTEDCNVLLLVLVPVAVNVVRFGGERRIIIFTNARASSDISKYFKLERLGGFP